MSVSESSHNQIATQLASLSILPVWYPFFAKSVYQRFQILESKSPGDLSHSNFFTDKRNYYRGITTNLSMQPLFPITDYILGTLLKAIQETNRRKPNLAERIGAGFITGNFTVILANPYEVTVIASQKHRETPYKEFRRVLNHSGIRGLYTGAVPMAIRNGTFISSIFVTAPALQKKLEQTIPGSGKAYNVATMVLASTIPASIYTGVAIPLDFMAIMRQSDPSNNLYTSALQAIKAAYGKHGLAAFKAGYFNRLTACIIEIAGFNLFKSFYLGTLSNKD